MKRIVVLLALLLAACSMHAQSSFFSDLPTVSNCESGDLFLVDRPGDATYAISCDDLGLSSLFGVAVDLGNDGTDEITRLLRINTTGDTNAIFTESPTGRALVDLTKSWPTRRRPDDRPHGLPVGRIRQRPGRGRDLDLRDPVRVRRPVRRRLRRHHRRRFRDHHDDQRRLRRARDRHHRRLRWKLERGRRSDDRARARRRPNRLQRAPVRRRHRGERRPDLRRPG